MLCVWLLLVTSESQVNYLCCASGYFWLLLKGKLTIYAVFLVTSERQVNYLCCASGYFWLLLKGKLTIYAVFLVTSGYFWPLLDLSGCSGASHGTVAKGAHLRVMSVCLSVLLSVRPQETARLLLEGIS
jgi:hypothetical protein